MGRYSWCTTESSSRESEEDECVGIPHRCRCGLVPKIKTAENPPYKRLYMCPRVPEGGNHFFKPLDDIVLEEIRGLHTEVDEQMDLHRKLAPLHEIETTLETMNLSISELQTELTKVKAMKSKEKKLVGAVGVLIGVLVSLAAYLFFRLLM